MGQTVMFDYYYGLQADKYSFYRIPKILFTSDCFKILSCESKVLYGLLLDRMSLSVKNRWFDEVDRVYIIFPLEEVCELMNCAKQKAIKMMAELDSTKGIGLIEKKRLGLGKANVIYVKNFMVQERPESMKNMPGTRENTQKYENHTSRGMKSELQEVPKSNFKKYENNTSASMKSGLQEVPKSSPNYTDINDTEFSDTRSNHIIPADETIDAIGACREIILDNIDYGILCMQYQKESVDEIVELMLEVIASRKRSFRISGEDVDANIVKGRFMKITFSHIQYVFECLDKNTKKINNIKQYLLAVLFNAPATINHYYQAEVQHDIYGN